MKRTSLGHYAGLALILLLGGLLRFGELSSYGPTPGDDISYLNGVRESYAGLRQVMPEPEGIFLSPRPFFVANNLTQRSYQGMKCFTSLAKPFYVLKLALIEGAGELDLYRLQFSNAVSGMLLLLAVYLLARELFGKGAALVAAFLGAISPWMIHYSVYGVPTNDSALFLVLAAWLLSREKFRPFLLGFFLGIALMFNPTVVFPVAAAGLIGLARAWRERRSGRDFLSRAGFLTLGTVLPWLGWETGNAFYWSHFRLPWRSFWEALSLTRGDNTAHAQKLPVDPVFAFRSLLAADGIPQLLLWLAGTGWGVFHILRRPQRERFRAGSSWVLMLAVIVGATFTGVTQCARHDFPFWPLGLVWVGGMFACLRGWKRIPAAGLLALAAVTAAVSFANYRAARRGGGQVAAWLEENIPPHRVVTPANQPPNMWPGVKRFGNWDELEKLQKEIGPVWVIYGDYMAVSRGIWDFPREMFPIAMACRQVAGEDFRAPTHFSAPIFLHENEDYYWGFFRRPLRPFDSEVRVIPAAKILELKENLVLPDDALSSPGNISTGEIGSNVYLPFVRYGVNHPRSPWPGIAVVLALAGLLLYVSSPDISALRAAIFRRGLPLGLALVLLLGMVFRSWGISLFAPMGGDDVEYRTYIEKARTSPQPAFSPLTVPFAVASSLSQLDVNRTITVFAKPFFILERSILAAIFGGDFRWSHYLVCLYGLLAVLIAFGLGRRLGGPAAGFAAALVWAISPWATTYSTWGLHVAGGAVLFGLSLWAYVVFRSRPGPFRALVFGLAAGGAVMYSTSNLFSVLCLLLIETVSGLRRIFREKREAGVLGAWGMMLLGAILPLLLWEGMSFLCTRLTGHEYRSFPRVLLEAVADNRLHAEGLPVDVLFFWRHLFLSEGWVTAAAMVMAVLGSLRRLFSRRAGEGEGVLLALLFGLTVVMNFTGATQVIRHFFPAFFPLSLLLGLAISRILRRRPRLLIPLLVLSVLLVPRQWAVLEPFRENRWAPSRVKLWADGHLHCEHRVGTMPCQLMDIWPGMVVLNDWRDLDAFSRVHPPGIMMYGDYIELSLGSWVYSFPEQYEIRQVSRGLPRDRDLFRTPSYLNYRPGLFESEFYYWGLYREQPAGFDPFIRLIPAVDIIGEYLAVRAEPGRYQDLWEPTKVGAPLLIPARGRAIYHPYMPPLSSSLTWPWLLFSLAAFLGLAVMAVLPGCREPGPNLGGKSKP